jgi:hypothetical protein
MTDNLASSTPGVSLSALDDTDLSKGMTMTLEPSSQASTMGARVLASPLGNAPQAKPAAPKQAIIGEPLPILTRVKRDGEACGHATTSLILGLLSCVTSVLTALPAVIYGHKALNRIRESHGFITGRKQAVTGLVFGYLNLASFPVLLGVALPAFVHAQKVAQEAQTQAKEAQASKPKIMQANSRSLVKSESVK